MMGHREKMSGGDEFDCLSRKARRVHICLKRPGVCKSIKAKFNRRVRKNARLEAISAA